MPQIVDTVMIESKPFKVVIDAPEGVAVTNVQALAEAAWRSTNRRATIGGVTVRIEPA